MAISRRQFLTGSVVSAAAMGLTPWFRWLPGTGVSYAAGPSDAIVVFVQLFGGCDGIDVVYPKSGPQRIKYKEFRPTLQLPTTNSQMQPWVDEGFGSNTVLSIGLNNNGSEYALHPAMGALHQLYSANRLAVLNGVHYPFADHSHFRSTAIWYAADPLGAGGQGWFGKYMTAAGFQATEVPAVLVGGGRIRSSRQHKPRSLPTMVFRSRASRLRTNCYKSKRRSEASTVRLHSLRRPSRNS